jgi:hypothetical protein
MTSKIQVVLEGDTALAIRDLATGLLGSAAIPPTSGGGQTPPPPVVIQPPATVPDGTDIRQSYQATGTGPHVLEMLVSSEDYDPTWETNHYNEIDMYDANGVLFAENIRWAARAHAGDDTNAMVVTIRRQKPIAKPIKMVASGTGVDGRVSFHRVVIDGSIVTVTAPARYIYYDYPGRTWDGFQYLIWDDLDKLPAPPPPPPGVPTPTAQAPTVFTGKINGVDVPGVTLDKFGPMLKAGDVGELPPGLILGTCVINAPARLKGSASAQTILSCDGINLTFGKAVIVPNVMNGGPSGPNGGVVIESLAITGRALNDDGGAAGIRDNAHGQGFTARNVEVSHRPQGIASFQSEVLVEDSNLHENGTGDGQGHNCYAQRATDASKSEWLVANGTPMPPSTFTVRRTRSDKPLGGHAIKSRAEVTIVEDCPILENDGNAHVVDFPNGGTATMRRCTITPKPGPGGNKVALTFGVEGMFNSGTTLSLDDVVIDDTALGASSYVIGATGSNLALHTTTYKGAEPTVQVFTVVGSMTPAG